MRKEHLLEYGGVDDLVQEDLALLHARVVRPFVVHELRGGPVRDLPELEASLAEREVRVRLAVRPDVFAPRQERARLAGVLVPRLQLDESPPIHDP